MPFSGSRLRRLRTERGKSREELALSIGRGYATVAAYESDRVAPPLRILESLADSLGVSVAALIDERGAA